MKHPFLKSTTSALLPALLFGGMLVLASCNSESKEPKQPPPPMTAAPAHMDSSYNTTPGVAGSVTEDVFIVQAMVRAVDVETRKVTLADSDNDVYSFTANPAIKNLAQLHAGDRVTATFSRRMVVMVRDMDAEPSNSHEKLDASAKLGEKPGMLVAEETKKIARVRSIDATNRIADLEFADGVSRRVPIRADVDLSKYSVGDNVIIRVTTALTVLVESAK